MHEHHPRHPLPSSTLICSHLLHLLISYFLLYFSVHLISSLLFYFIYRISVPPQCVGPAHEFYKSALMFLAYTPLEDMSPSEVYILATDMALASVTGDDIYNFGEWNVQQ